MTLNNEIAEALGYCFDLSPEREGRTSGSIISPDGTRRYTFFNLPLQHAFVGKHAGLRDWEHELEAAFQLIADGTPEAEDIEINITREWDFLGEKRGFRVDVLISGKSEPDAIGFGTELAEAVATAGLIYRRSKAEAS